MKKFDNSANAHTHFARLGPPGRRHRTAHSASAVVALHKIKVLIGLAQILYIRCIYGIFGRKIINYSVIYGAYIRFWPTLST